MKCKMNEGGLPEFARCGVLSQWGLELIKIRNVSCLHISEYGNNEGLSIRLREKCCRAENKGA